MVIDEDMDGKGYGFRFDGTEKEIMLGTPNTELRMVYMTETHYKMLACKKKMNH